MTEPQLVLLYEESGDKVPSSKSSCEPDCQALGTSTNSTTPRRRAAPRPELRGYSLDLEIAAASARRARGHAVVAGEGSPPPTPLGR